MRGNSSGLDLYSLDGVGDEGQAGGGRDEGGGGAMVVMMGYNGRMEGSDLGGRMEGNGLGGAMDGCASRKPGPKRKEGPVSHFCQNARKRRERLTRHIRALEKLVPQRARSDAASVLESAISFIKRLSRENQVRKLVPHFAGCAQRSGIAAALISETEPAHPMSTPAIPPPPLPLSPLSVTGSAQGSGNAPPFI
ncbi:unnamed protein product [Closterium sp. NIES-64]|nr:unnamed protein product [Closterium sp. NIES-64]